MQRSHYENLHRQGRFKELKSLSARKAQELDVVDLAVLSHSLSGEFTKALWLVEQLDLSDLKPDRRAAIHFAVGLGWTRVSEYKKAKKEFAKLSRFKGAVDSARYYLFQAMGFYHFFTGKFAKSAGYAQTALKLATRCQFGFGQLISEELLALGYLESGSVHLGLKHLKQATRRAQEFSNESLASGFELNRLLYSARFGITAKPIEELGAALLHLHPEDSYSRGNVKLELANQLILHGRAEEAQTTLELAAEEIYASRNRRQIALLNFRLCFLIYMRGSADHARHLLRSAEHHLHPSVDLNLLKKMRGLKARLELKTSAPRLPSPEDRLGQMAQDARERRKDVLAAILNSQRLHFLYAYFDLEPDQRLLAFDVLPRGVVILDRGEVRLIPRGFSDTLRRILQILAQGHISKEELVNRVWGYNYDPLRHDSLIYTTISKIRGWLGRHGAWVENDHRGYRLQTGVQLWSPTERRMTPLPAPAPYPVRPRPEFELSLRLLRILARIEKYPADQVINAQFIMQNFNVSRATATRDLNDLVRHGLLRKIGRARATAYLRRDV